MIEICRIIEISNVEFSNFSGTEGVNLKQRAAGSVSHYIQYFFVKFTYEPVKALLVKKSNFPVI